MTAAWRGPLACLALAGLVTGCTSGSDPQPAQESATGLSHEEQMQDMADDYGITAPPEVDVVREITPDESVTVIADCMRDAGWPAQIVDGVAEYEFTLQQEEEFNRSHLTCHAQYPIDQRYTRPWTDEQVALAYEHVTSVWIPCLAQHGVELPAPSEAVFRQSPQSGWYDSQALFTQLQTLEESGEIESVEWLQEECPQWPPDSVLFPQE